MLQSLNRKIIYIRRQLAADSVVRVGQRLREIERNNQDATDLVAAYPEIERLERQRERLLAYIRRTA